MTFFDKAKEQVAKDGLMVTNRFGGVDKHPLLGVIKDSNIQVVKIIHEFGLSPAASGKIKESSNGDEDYKMLAGLING